MSAEEIINLLLRNQNLTDGERATLFTAIQGLNPKADDLADLELIIHPTGIKERIITELPIRNLLSASANQPIRNHDPQVMKRQIPDPVISYPMVHTDSGSYTFGLNRKYQGGLTTDGTFYQVIDDYSRLNQTAKISISGFLYLPTISADGIIVAKDQQYELKVISGNKLSWRVYSGSWHTALTYTFTSNTWFNFLVTYDSSVGQKIIINGSQVASDSTSGAINSTSNNLGIFGSATGSDLMPNNSIISWLHLNKNALSTSWASNYNSGLLKTDGSDIEITTLPFIDDTNPRPDSTSGLC